MAAIAAWHLLADGYGIASSALLALAAIALVTNVDVLMNKRTSPPGARATPSRDAT